MGAFLGAAKPRLFTDFDLLGFDPRGFGGSERTRCLTTQHKLDSLPDTPDYRERTQQTADAEIAWGKVLWEACAGDEFARFVSTQQIVHDLDFLRALFKAPKLNYIGYSYGTMLGSRYADTYPSKVRRFVLDSNMAFGKGWQQHYSAVPMSGQRRFDKQLIPWLARHADQIDGLGDTPAELKAKYESIRAKLVTLLKAGTSSVRGDRLDRRIFGDLYTNTGMVIAALEILVHDEYTKAPSTSGKSDEPVDLNGGFYAVMCNDTRWSTDVARHQREAERATAAYPFYGYMVGISECAFWKYPAQERAIDLKGTPRMMMVQGELDVITPYEPALREHRDTKRSTRFVAVDDEGQHGQYVFGPSSCVDEIGDRYVFDGVVPAEDVVCGTSPLPGDTEVHRVRGPVNGGVHSSNGEMAASSRSSALQRVFDAAVTLP